jgi:hypothetical protein
MKAQKPVNKITKKIKTKNTITIEKPDGRGNPKYAKWMNDVAKTLAKEGKNQNYIFKVLGISDASGIKYKKLYPDFAKSLEDGYKDPRKVAEDKLYKLVKGYEFDSEQIVVVSDGNLQGSHVERVPVKKRIEPNLRAIEYFLNNRKSRKENPKDGWGNTTEIELGNLNNEPFIIEIK